MWWCLCCHFTLFDISVGVGAFFIGRSQISSLLSLHHKLLIWKLAQLKKFRFTMTVWWLSILQRSISYMYRFGVIDDVGGYLCVSLWFFSFPLLWSYDWLGSLPFHLARFTVLLWLDLKQISKCLNIQKYVTWCPYIKYLYKVANMQDTSSTSYYCLKQTW